MASSNPSSPPSRMHQQRALAQEPQPSLSCSPTTLPPNGPYSQDLAELPDLFQDLFVQLSNNLTTFTCFPDLPKEIRVMIWLLAFPRGRRVNLNYHVGLYTLTGWAKRERKRTISIETHCRLPGTLYADQESRQETLRHYIILIRPITQEYNKLSARPICYNPLLDSGYFIDGNIAESLQLVNQNALLRGESSLLSSIEELEIRDWEYWSWANRTLRSSLEETNVPETCSCSIFFSFPGLKRLVVRLSQYLLMKREFVRHQYARVRLAQEWNDFVKKFTPTGREPFEVSVKEWSELRTRL